MVEKKSVQLPRVVCSQGRNLTELAGICLNGGICGLIRQSTKILPTLYRNYFYFYFYFYLRVGIAWLSTVRVLKYKIKFSYERNLYKILMATIFIFFLQVKSSHYGLFMLGHTRFTKVKTKSCKKEILSEPLKITLFGLIFAIQNYEDGIVSNRR